VLRAAGQLGGRGRTQHVAGLALDLGCGWLHSADRNSWRAIADAARIPVDRGTSAWGEQFRALGFTPAEQAAAHEAFGEWLRRLADTPPTSDCAADALEPGNEWNSYIRAICGFISGGRLERLSVADYVAYDAASTENNWRVPTGYGDLIAGSVPAQTELSLATPVEAIVLEKGGVSVVTPAGRVRARAAVLTVSTAVLAGDSIRLPAGLDPWRQAARELPLGHNEKFFLQIVGDGPFEAETHVIGNPRDEHTGSYYIRPFGRPVIECFLGSEGARLVEESGADAGFALATEQVVSLFGSEVRRLLQPLASSSWSGLPRIGGAYSYALPGHTAARHALAKPFGQRLFFAGEATSIADFSTAHGAHDSGVRAADEACAALR
jgi:monoamine oxidase